MKNFKDLAAAWSRYLRHRFPELQSELTATDADFMCALLNIADTCVTDSERADVEHGA